jgi:hypothetical protein
MDARAAGNAAEAGQTQAPWRMYVSGWTFAPIWNGPEVVAFLAVADEGANQGANFEVMWFEEDASGHWTSAAWPAGYRASAYRWVAALVGDPDIWNDDVEATDALMNDLSESHVPIPLHAGLQIEDPVQEVLASHEDPGWLVNALASVGYEAAPVLSGLVANAEVAGTVTCEAQPHAGIDDMLDQMAMSAELTLHGYSDRVNQGSCHVLCDGCTKTVTIVLGAWVNTGSTLVGSSLHCHYSRTDSRHTVYSGLTMLLCDPCPPYNQTCTRTVRGDTTSLPGQPCPSGTPGTVFPAPSWTCP